MQMFKDLDFKLEINQKLQILRSIKKFCFNFVFVKLKLFQMLKKSL